MWAALDAESSADVGGGRGRQVYPDMGVLLLTMRSVFWLNIHLLHSASACPRLHEHLRSTHLRFFAACQAFAKLGLPLSHAVLLRSLQLSRLDEQHP